jgi:hypothetical protein
MYELEKSVFKALQDIPFQISQAYQSVKAYSGLEDAAELNCQMVSLYGAVLRAYTSIMVYFSEKTRREDTICLYYRAKDL